MKQALRVFASMLGGLAKARRPAAKAAAKAAGQQLPNHEAALADTIT